MSDKNACEECLDDITVITNLFTSAAVHHKDEPLDEMLTLTKKCGECGITKIVHLVP